MLLIVLMQRPKQEGLGAAFGAGVTDQMWGAQTTNVLQRGTVYLAVLFFVITMILAVLVNTKQKGMRNFNKKMTATTTPTAPPSAPPTSPAVNAPPLSPESVKLDDITLNPDSPITIAPKPAGDTPPITVAPTPPGDAAPVTVPPKPAGDTPTPPPAVVIPDPEVTPAPAETGDTKPKETAPAEPGVTKPKETAPAEPGDTKPKETAPATEGAEVESGDAIEKLLEELNADPKGAAVEAVEESTGAETDKPE